MRQLNFENDPDQAQFLELLPRARNGENTIADWTLLCARQPTPFNLPAFEYASRLFMVNDKVNEYNIIKLNKIDEPKLKLIAFNSDVKCRQASVDNFRGLENIIYCCINSHVILTSNIWTNKCLVNSAHGIIRDIIFFKSKEKEELPEIILIEVFNYSGPQFFSNDGRKNWLPFEKIKIFSKYHNGFRKQFTFRLSYAQTIHKSQGIQN